MNDEGEALFSGMKHPYRSGYIWMQKSGNRFKKFNLIELTGWIGFGEGMCTGDSLVPKLYKIIRKKTAENISYGMLPVLIIGLTGLFWYGIRNSDLPIIFTNAFAILVIYYQYFAVKYKVSAEDEG